MARLISAALRVGNIVSKKRRSCNESLATLRLIRLSLEWDARPGDSDVFYHYASRPKLPINKHQSWQCFTGSVKECSSIELPYEVACLSIDSLSSDEDMETCDQSISGPSKLCAVGLWTDNSARVLRLPNLQELHSEILVDGNLFHCFYYF